MSYQILNDFNGNVRNDGVRRLSDGAFIPNDELNRDWKIYNQWLSAGNQPEMPSATDPIKLKTQRDNFYKNDLSMVAMYQLAKEKDPTLEFSAYLDALEIQKINIP